MSAKERIRLEMLKRIKRGELTVMATELTGLSLRQSRQVWKHYRQAGDGGLVLRRFEAFPRLIAPITSSRTAGIPPRASRMAQRQLSDTSVPQQRNRLSLAIAINPIFASDYYCLVCATKIKCAS